MSANDEVSDASSVTSQNDQSETSSQYSGSFTSNDTGSEMTKSASQSSIISDGSMHTDFTESDTLASDVHGVPMGASSFVDSYIATSANEKTASSLVDGEELGISGSAINGNEKTFNKFLDGATMLQGSVTASSDMTSPAATAADGSKPFSQSLESSGTASRSSGVAGGSSAALGAVTTNASLLNNSSSQAASSADAGLTTNSVSTAFAVSAGAETATVLETSASLAISSHRGTSTDPGASGTLGSSAMIGTNAAGNTTTNNDSVSEGASATTSQTATQYSKNPDLSTIGGTSQLSQSAYTSAGLQDVKTQWLNSANTNISSGTTGFASQAAKSTQGSDSKLSSVPWPVDPTLSSTGTASIRNATGSMMNTSLEGNETKRDTGTTGIIGNSLSNFNTASSSFLPDESVLSISATLSQKPKDDEKFETAREPDWMTKSFQTTSILDSLKEEPDASLVSNFQDIGLKLGTLKLGDSHEHKIINPDAMVAAPKQESNYGLHYHIAGHISQPSSTEIESYRSRLRIAIKDSAELDGIANTMAQEGWKKGQDAIALCAQIQESRKKDLLRIIAAKIVI